MNSTPPRPRRARATLIRIAATALAATALGATSAAAAPPPPCNEATDALCKRELANLASFTTWLAKTGAKGYIGEVGWPTYPNENNTSDGWLWNQLGQRWFQAADAAGLPVTGWSAGEWYQPGYKLNIYEHVDHTWPMKPLSVRRLQADVFEAHYGASGGVNSVGGENTQLGFSNKNPGKFGTDWWYDSQASFNFLSARGVKVVRMLFRWERVQPTLGGPIDTTGAGFTTLLEAIRRAGTAGLKVIIEPHNFGGYTESAGVGGRAMRKAIGSGAGNVPPAQFADFWQKLATALKGETALHGYGLMNEPQGMSKPMLGTAASVWASAAQQAVTAIRATDATRTIYVPAYAWDGVRSFAACHPAGPWIKDPANNIRYEAHQYFDHDGSGEYKNAPSAANGWSGYAVERNLAQTSPQGNPAC